MEKKKKKRKVRGQDLVFIFSLGPYAGTDRIKDTPIVENSRRFLGGTLFRRVRGIVVGGIWDGAKSHRVRAGRGEQVVGP